MVRSRHTALRIVGMALLCAVPALRPTFAQQVIERGASGKPAQLLNEAQEWTPPVLVSSARDVEMYVPDVSNPAWLKRNYRRFEDQNRYEITMYTLYHDPRSCRLNQMGWGLGDAAHLDACADIGYRLRQASVDIGQKTVTLLRAGMVDQNGQLDPASIRSEPLVRRWSELDPNTRAALARTTEMVTRQMALYDRRQQTGH